MRTTDFDYCIVGAGIVGLATAMALIERQPGVSIVILEKEGELASHQTGHNSGVIHAGIYYQPGSLKAKLCREGAAAVRAFCRDNAIAFEDCGKLLVATDPVEMERMAGLAERARQNGIAFEELDGAALRRREPAVAGLGALLVPATGIVDYRAICRAMAERIAAAGGRIVRNARVTSIAEDERGVTVRAGDLDLRVGRLVACAGLQSDRIAVLAGLKPDFRIVPFRGEYYTLPASRSSLVSHLIYPVPDPELPFLGIHLTRMIDGSVTVGPNAVLGFSREGYPKGSVSFGDLADMMAFAGFWRVIAANWRSGVAEFASSLFKRRYLRQCRKYCPSLTEADLGRPSAGIRAQAVMADGTLVHDFLFLQTGRMLHVCNAPSPAATSAIPIARMIVERMLDHDDFGSI